jgi:hypothetical protein
MTRIIYTGLALFICLVALLEPWHAVASPKKSAGCKVYFTVVEHDEQTSNLNMAGLTETQKNWWGNHGSKESPGICFVGGNATSERVTTESADEAYMEKTVGSSPLYSIAWGQHRLFIPDNTGGYYVWAAQGILSIYDAKANNGNGDFVAVTPVRNTNRSNLSSSETSLLKDAIREIEKRSSTVLVAQ